MEDKYQLLSHRKPLGENEQGVDGSRSCSPDHPPAGRSAVPYYGELNPSAGGGPITRSPDGPITQSPASHDCRECLGAMAHRMAQPMTALRGGIELGLMGKRSAADYRAVLEQSLQLADHMVQMIVSLRDLGESGAPAGQPQSIFLDSTVAEVVAEMEGLAQSHDLRLQLNTQGKANICADPERLHEALQSLLAWVIQNSAGGGFITMEVSVSERDAHLFLSPPRLDLQYLQIKVLEDITTPGVLFSYAAKNGALGWAINQRLLDGLGGKLEILTVGQDAGCIRVSFPTAPDS